MKLIKKFLAVTSIFYSLYGLTKLFIENYIKQIDGLSAVILLGKGSNIRENIEAELNNKPYKALIYGKGDNLLSLDTDFILSNTYYIYANIDKHNYQLQLFEQYNDLKAILTKITYKYEDINNRQDLTFEIFNLDAKYINNINYLPTGTKIIAHTPSAEQKMDAINNEFLLRALKYFIKNDYIRFIFDILLNPKESSFNIITNDEVKQFIYINDNYDKLSIIDRQNIAVKKFIHFIIENNIKDNDKIAELFKEFQLNDAYINDTLLLPNWYHMLQGNQINRIMELALFNHICDGDNFAVKTLLENGISPNITLQNAITPIIKATKCNKIDMINLLIEYNSSINAKKDYGITALMISASKNYNDILQLLISKLDNPQEINAQDINLNTALIYAAMKENWEGANLLLLNEADINAENIYGYNGLYYATISSNDSAIQLFLDNEAKLNQKVIDLIDNNCDLLSVFCLYPTLFEADAPYMIEIKDFCDQ